MKKEVKLVDKKKGIVQITTLDERWYARVIEKEINKVPKCFSQYAPSNTWIVGKYPKGKEFMKWMASTGYDESILIRDDAGQRGSIIHQAVENLLNGEIVKIDKPIMRGEEELGVMDTEEWEAVMSFIEWWNSIRLKYKSIEILAIEVSCVYDESGGSVHEEADNEDGHIIFGATIDFVVRLNGQAWIIDWKSSRYVYKPYELQMIGSKMALIANGIISESDNAQMGIVQLGYKGNKKGFKFTHVKPSWELYKAVYEIWREEHENDRPLQRDMPMKLKIDVPKRKDEIARKPKKKASKKKSKK